MRCGNDEAVLPRIAGWLGLTEQVERRTWATADVQRAVRCATCDAMIVGACDVRECAAGAGAHVQFLEGVGREAHAITNAGLVAREGEAKGALPRWAEAAAADLQRGFQLFRHTHCPVSTEDVAASWLAAGEVPAEQWPQRLRSTTLGVSEEPPLTKLPGTNTSSLRADHELQAHSVTGDGGRGVAPCCTPMVAAAVDVAKHQTLGAGCGGAARCPCLQRSCLDLGLCTRWLRELEQRLGAEALNPDAAWQDRGKVAVEAAWMRSWVDRC
mmetsp:Transcript_64551/g.166146  ORF Transcript_64551/g.166146 Transcript_64551/m.166146 type:complete len:270 (-) Transcript_64551:600-1409(-)